MDTSTNRNEKSTGSITTNNTRIANRGITTNDIIVPTLPKIVGGKGTFLLPNNDNDSFMDI